MRLNAKNNAETRLAEPVSETDTTIVVEDASVLPEVPYRLSIGDEIVEVTGADGNTLTVDRAVEGTEAFSHGEGVSVENRFTSGMYDGIESYVEQKIDEIPETDLSGYVKKEDFSSHSRDSEKHVTPSEKETWNAKQDALSDNQIRPIYVQAEEPENPKENAIWIEIE